MVSASYFEIPLFPIYQNVHYHTPRDSSST